MPIATFDTLKFANTLKAADLPPKQAEALAVAFAEVIQLNFKDLATKDDLKGLDTATKNDIKALETALRAEIKDVRVDLKTAIVKIEAEIRIMRWMLGAIGGGIVLILGVAVRYLFLHGGL